jgi:hypothetical protein
LILGAVAIAATSFGAKKGYDGYQDKSEANTILENSKSKYEASKKQFDKANEKTEKSLVKLGTLQLNIGSDFKEFRTIAKKLLEKLEQSGSKDLTLEIPQHQLQKIDRLALSTTAYLGQVAGGGVAGVAAAYAVYGGVMALAAASTGTPIAALSGAAAYNAAMAAIGGGSLAAGGFGMAGGAMVLGGVVAAPILAIAGWAFASHAENALSDAKSTRREVRDAILKMEKGGRQLAKTRRYVNHLFTETNYLYTEFSGYFETLKQLDQFRKTGGDIATLEDEVIQTVNNGYQAAAIMTDIITTPLFKPKRDANNNIVMNKENVVEIETDAEGMQVINYEALDEVLEQVEWVKNTNKH